MVRALLATNFTTIIKKLTLCVIWTFSGPGTGHSCYSASGIGLQSSQCETCGTEIHNSPRVCRKAPLKGEGHWGGLEKKVAVGTAVVPRQWLIFSIFSSLEFHYRYNTPGQNYLNRSERCVFVELSFSDENKLFSPCKYISCMIPSL